MSKSLVLRCPDGHYRHVIFDLAGFIADYPEQVYLAGTVQGWCPRLVIASWFAYSTEIFFRCTAMPDDLDGEHGRRTRKFTETILDTLGSKMLWDEYGIDSNILVCKLLSILLSSQSDCKIIAIYI